MPIPTPAAAWSALPDPSALSVKAQEHKISASREAAYFTVLTSLAFYTHDDILCALSKSFKAHTV